MATHFWCDLEQIDDKISALTTQINTPGIRANVRKDLVRQRAGLRAYLTRATAAGMKTNCCVECRENEDTAHVDEQLIGKTDHLVDVLSVGHW